MVEQGVEHGTIGELIQEIHKQAQISVAKPRVNETRSSVKTELWAITFTGFKH